MQTQNDAPAEGIGLLAIVVPHETDLVLHHFMLAAKEQLEAASPDLVNYSILENPRRSGRRHKSRRTKARQRADAKGERLFRRGCAEAGAKDDYLLAEYQEFLRRHHLEGTSRPFLFIWVPGRPNQQVIVPLPRDVADGRENRERLLAFLTSELSDKTATQFAGEPNRFSQRDLNQYGNHLNRKIRDSFGNDANADQSKPTKQSASFPTPTGAKWQDVDIKFTDGHTVLISVRDVRRRYNYTQMGMVDCRNGNPTAQWNLLRDFAEADGQLTWESRGANRKNQKRKEVLGKQLRRFFGIDGDPFQLLEDRSGWKTRFRLRPDR